MRKIDPPHLPDPVLGIADVVAATSLSKGTIYRLMKSRRFPAAKELTPGGSRVGWLASEVNEWAAAPLDWDPDQINF
jgi:predicted DNA-binding transcriptional regulator AlpA